MVVRNNYYWLEESSNVGFIANGDILNVVKIKKKSLNDMDFVCKKLVFK